MGGQLITDRMTLNHVIQTLDYVIPALDYVIPAQAGRWIQFCRPGTETAIKAGIN